MKILSFTFSLVLTMTAVATSTCSQNAEVCGNLSWKVNLDIWQSQKIMNYDFVVQRYHDPTYSHIPYLIKVRKGETTSLEPTRENSGLELTDGYAEVASVDKMFDLIKDTCRNGSDTKVEYDEKLGYPKKITITTPGKGIHNGDSYVIEEFSRAGSEK